ncbi:hypothetical protein TRFO_41570 [Tritrichomonas foetus]|uniref:Uncharacterized protein n=1 Tax=Tritrichomonas foetus TaxID=1144522 RepID=A0A1J4L039_9EUKA|nr:hypothetical protein TRFO_41570 [Tritrichomonas foetus]|eukprot:OHT16778.1 hypothetical protein TRFO_41570 [Tritrichomonas foetus]
MSENSDNFLGNICLQWTQMLALNICHSLETDSKTLEAKIPSLGGKDAKNPQQFLQKGVAIMDKYNPQTSKQMLRALDYTMLDFATDPRFPRVFSSLVTTMHSLFVLPYSGNVKAKALHTDQVLTNETLSPFEQLKCTVFEFLSNLLTQAAESQTSNYQTISKEIIAIIFRFSEHDQPNAVRASAGRIISALSVHPNHCNEIINLFWSKFSKCKKNDDFRNFAALIDLIVNLEFSFENDESTKVVVGFFKFFLDNSKRIERGVLRLKFLDALTSIIKSLNEFGQAPSIMEYTKQLDGIWNLALKWSSKGKHTPFCYTFMQNMLLNSFPAFFTTNHGPAFLDLIIKYSKTEPNGALELLTDWVKSVPDNYARSDEFNMNINKVIIPFLFPLKDNTKTLRYKAPEQTNMCVSIVADLAAKQTSQFVILSQSILSAESAKNPLNKSIRLIFIQGLAKAAQETPDVLKSSVSQLNPFVEPILTGQDEEEFESVLPAFPLIINTDTGIQKRIADILYKVSFSDKQYSSAAFSALCRYIEIHVKLGVNLSMPFNYICNEVTGIGLLQNFEYLKKLSLLMRLTEVLQRVLQPSIGELSSIAKGDTSVTIADVKTLFKTLYCEILPILISHDKSDREIAVDFISMYNSEVFNALAQVAFEESYFSLAKWVSEQPKEKDIINNFNEIMTLSPSSANQFFEFLINYWTNNSNMIDQQNIPRIMSVLTRLCNELNENTKKLFVVIFKILKANPVAPGFFSMANILTPNLWTPFSTEFISFLAANNLAPNNFWPNMVSFYSSFSLRPEFPEAIKDSQLNSYYQSFISTAWKTFDDHENTFQITEKALKIMSAFIDANENSKVVDDSLVGQFIEYILKCSDLSQATNIPQGFMDTLFTTLHRIFSRTKVESDFFEPLQKFIAKCCQVYTADERIQMLISQLLSDVLRVNPCLLKQIFSMIFSDDENMASYAILSIANAYQAHDDFGEIYQLGHPTIFATTVLHITNELIKPRQAAFKLMCLMISRKNDIFTTEAPPELRMPLTSPSPTGYQIQAQQFSKFASSSILPSAALAAFKMIADEMPNMTQKQRPFMSSLVEICPILAKADPLSEVIDVLLRITSFVDNSNAGIAEATKTLWMNFTEAISEKRPKDAKELIKTVFEYGVNQEDLRSKQSQLAVIALCYIFLVFPHKTIKFLRPRLLKKYQMSLPPLDKISEYISSGKLKFTPTKEEIIIANTLSQVFLIIEDRKLFTKCFVNEFPLYLLISILIRSDDNFNIGQFHPLLDSLLDVAMFRFTNNNDRFSSNLHALQEANMVTRATTLDEQYRIISDEGSRAMIAYDEKAVQTLVGLFNNIDHYFQEEFFGSLIGLAFQVDPDDPRANEPFLLMMHVGQYMTSDSLFLILMYTLHSVKENKTQLLDCIMDCIRGHLMVDDLNIDAFKKEIVPVIIVFLIFLTLQLKQSMSLHIMKVLSEIIEKVIQRCEGQHQEVFQNVVEYMTKFKGDQFIASVIMKYITELKSFGDQNCAEVIRFLASLSRVYGNDSNWCMLLADLADGARSFIGEAGEKKSDRVLQNREYKNVSEFVELLIINYSNDEDKLRFIISFFCNVVCTAKSVDIQKEAAVVQILNSLLSREEMTIPDDLLEKLVQFVSLVSIICDKKYKPIASSIILCLLSKTDNTVPAAALSYSLMQPKFVTMKMRQFNSYKDEERTYIDLSTLPNFPLFEELPSFLSVISDLYDHIKGQITKGDELEFITIKQRITV